MQILHRRRATMRNRHPSAWLLPPAPVPAEFLHRCWLRPATQLPFPNPTASLRDRTSHRLRANTAWRPPGPRPAWMVLRRHRQTKTHCPASLVPRLAPMCLPCDPTCRVLEDLRPRQPVPQLPCRATRRDRHRRLASPINANWELAQLPMLLRRR